jgi:hypothetical protein
MPFLLLSATPTEKATTVSDALIALDVFVLWLALTFIVAIAAGAVDGTRLFSRERQGG